MGFCKENEICKPFVCRDAVCPIGEKLRNLPKTSKCGEICLWIRQGINEVNLCKDAACPTGNIIVEFKKMKRMK